MSLKTNLCPDFLYLRIIFKTNMTSGSHFPHDNGTYCHVGSHFCIQHGHTGSLTLVVRYSNYTQIVSGK